MDNQTFTLAELKQILRGAAGTAEGIDLDGDILDIGFDELGYDSLALLETGGRIEREYGVRLDDSALVDASTPRALLATINAHLGAVRTA
jgi:minimal PKS acyl carrier protein